MIKNEDDLNRGFNELISTDVNQFWFHFLKWGGIDLDLRVHK